MSDSELTLALNEIGITSDAHHVRFVWIGSDGKRAEWPHDVWSVTLHHGDKTHTTEFKCGIGHRKLPAGFPKKDIRGGDRGSEYYVERLGWLDDVKAAEAALTKPVAPTTADVLACLLSDASGGRRDVRGVVLELRVQRRLMKVMEIYRTCQKTWSALQWFLGQELMDRLGGLEH